MSAASLSLFGFGLFHVSNASVHDWIAAADFTTYATAFRDLIAALFRAWDLYLVDPIDLRPLTGPAMATQARQSSGDATRERYSERASSNDA